MSSGAHPMSQGPYKVTVKPAGWICECSPNGPPLQECGSCGGTGERGVSVKAVATLDDARSEARIAVRVALPKSALRILLAADREHRPVKTFALFSGGNDSAVLAHWAKPYIDELVLVAGNQRDGGLAASPSSRGAGTDGDSGLEDAAPPVPGACGPDEGREGERKNGLGYEAFGPGAAPQGPDVDALRERVEALETALDGYALPALYDAVRDLEAIGEMPERTAEWRAAWARATGILAGAS